MLKIVAANILNDYLNIFPEEQGRQMQFKNYLDTQSDTSICDMNNMAGHVTTGAFVYAQNEEKFLVLFHKDLNMYLYPGGHVTNFDINPLGAARRELMEETGIKGANVVKIGNSELVPIDIDTHMINNNSIIGVGEHYHYDIRYLFIIPNICDIKLDLEEHSDYRWISKEELMMDSNFGNIVAKIDRFISTK